MQISGPSDGITLDIHESCDTSAFRIVTRGTGNRLMIGRDCQITGYLFVADGAEITIGKNVKSTGPLTFHVHEGSSVSIGDGCLFSQNVVFRPSDVHKIIDLDTGQRINGPKPIRIGPNIWVGEQVMFLKGASVTAGSVVGTRSTVTAEFQEENVLIVGTPAKVSRRNITWKP